MFLHVALLVESFATVLAGVGPRVRVYQEMSGQCGASLERLAALFAFERFFGRVYGPVLAETYFVAERFVAHFTGEGPFTGMRSPSVYFQAVRRAEHFVAFDARKDEAVAVSRSAIVSRPGLADPNVRTGQVGLVWMAMGLGGQERRAVVGRVVWEAVGWEAGECS